MDAYSRDDMGDGRPLSDWARSHLIEGLREHPTSTVFLAFRGLHPVAIATCFRGFSTFAARPLINISDYFVLPECRGNGIGRQLLELIECRARELGWQCDPTVWRKDWGVHVQPFGSGENAVKYLGAYVARSVIADSRRSTFAAA